VILIDDPETCRLHAQAVTDAVRQGAKAIWLELPVGMHRIAGDDVGVGRCGMGPVHFVSRATGHPLVREFQPEDFRFWYDAALGYPSPLLGTVFTGKGWTPILTGGNGNWAGEWQPALVAAERREGDGTWRICQLRLSGRTRGNPVAEIFARRLLTE
jgi:hypothetical protein